MSSRAYLYVCDQWSYSRLQTEELALRPTAPDLALVPPTVPEPPRKRRGPKGPNPLSVKKKATPTVQSNVRETSHIDAPSKVGDKRKRFSEVQDGDGDGPHKRRKRKRR